MRQSRSMVTTREREPIGGRYELQEGISAGAMGAVYRAVDVKTGSAVAIKRLLDVQHSIRFTIEARLLQRLSHPNLVKLLDHVADATGNYLVMELIEGDDLGRKLTSHGKPGLPLDEVLGYAHDACAALSYLHDEQVVHRDVKPQNLVVGESLVLVDLGIAKEIGGDLTTGTIGIGTPRFMAPEIFTGAVSPRADVFGLAATVWMLLTGSPPMYGDDLSITDHAPQVPREIGEALRAGLEFMPEHRISSAAALATALGVPLEGGVGESLAISIDDPDAPSSILEAVVKTAAGVFEAASASIALTDEVTGELVYQTAWGAGASAIVGTRLPRGEGISGSVVTSGAPAVVPKCAEDPRFQARIAAGTGYVPNTMLVLPLRRGVRVRGVLSLLDRRDGGAYEAPDIERASLFAELALAVLELPPDTDTRTLTPPPA